MLKENPYLEKEKLIEEVLKTPPGFTLPDDFAAKMAVRVSQRFAWEQYFREFLVYFGAIAGIVALCAAMSFLLLGASPKGWLHFLTANIDLVASAGVLLIFVLFADRVALRYLMYRNSSRYRQLN